MSFGIDELIIAVISELIIAVILRAAGGARRLMVGWLEDDPVSPDDGLEEIRAWLVANRPDGQGPSFLSPPERILK